MKVRAKSENINRTDKLLYISRKKRADINKITSEREDTTDTTEIQRIMLDYYKIINK